MTEGLFILTTIFVAYVVYSVIGERGATAKSKAPAEAQATVLEPSAPQIVPVKEKPAEVKVARPEVAATPPVAEQPVAVKAVQPKVTATKAAAEQQAAAKTTEKPAAAKTAAPKAPASKAKKVVVSQSGGLKNPKTGEVASSYANYRFAKRWIKDALVEEGLLEKVYTANELNAEIDAKIKQAIAKLEALDNYKA